MEQTLSSATSVATDCLGFDDVVYSSPGRCADLIVLDQSPLEDIGAAKILRAVDIAGSLFE